MAEPLQITINDREVSQHPISQKDWDEESLKAINIRLKELYIAAINKMQREIIPKLPRGATGLLKQSYAGTEVRGRGLDVTGVFGSTSPYAPSIEDGQRAHFPPPNNLILWVRRKLGVSMDEAPGVAFAVARRIAGQSPRNRRGGTKGQKQVQTWLNQNQDQLLDSIIRGLDGILEEMVGQ
jgi:hypothetical protein